MFTVMLICKNAENETLKKNGGTLMETEIGIFPYPLCFKDEPGFTGMCNLSVI